NVHLLIRVTYPAHLSFHFDPVCSASCPIVVGEADYLRPGHLLSLAHLGVPPRLRSCITCELTSKAIRGKKWRTAPDHQGASKRSSPCTQADASRGKNGTRKQKTNTRVYRSKLPAAAACRWSAMATRVHSDRRPAEC